MVSQKRSTCCGRSSSLATSVMVRKVLGDLVPADGAGSLAGMSPGARLDRHSRPPGPFPGALPGTFGTGLRLSLMRFFSTCDGRKTRTLAARIGTSSPVLGLRPMRWPFWRMENVPNEESLTVSPSARASMISPRTDSQELGGLAPR